ncbi:hypothetical protein F4859DRAFT_502155 [Xylaria cf. heliscus]|nr:hypothetical protein F4859DRAFT_502155 [Xylaria cf. heliscus]
MQRRSVKKSRHGCKECKRRHVKCDESRPSCANCKVRHLPCSFLSGLPIPQPDAVPYPYPHHTATATSTATVISPPGSNSDLADPVALAGPALTVNPLTSMDPAFQLYHLELLHNFRTCVLASILEPFAVDGYMAMTVGESMNAPYLMDQLLAVSAANMSTKRPYQQRFYQDEATHLQTRGLASFNAAQAVAHNAMAGFVFSTLLSQHVIFDAFSTRTDFPAFLDKLVTSFHICGGVRIMTGKSWPFIRAQYRRQTGINLPGAFIAGSGPRVLRWAVQLPPDFIRLLEQRRPESLIITAYYALLIHDTRDYWAYSDAGAFIIRSITRFLGKYWAEWLAWPNEVLDSVERTDKMGLSSPIDISIQDGIDEDP